MVLFERPARGHRAALVSIRFSAHADAGDAHRDEFAELVRSADLVAAAALTASRDKPHPRWFLGAGKVDELEQAIADNDCTVVVFNHELSPAQQRNLEERLRCRVMPRTELILHIFANRARTHEGHLQVELAQLAHAQTRLVRGWTHLDRQTAVGGAGAHGAGGVQRGAGETQLELDQRMLATRVRQVRNRLANVRRRRAQSRRRRVRAHLPTVALVGYTNAGKSTLFNALTASQVEAADRLFATLDPTLRRLADDTAEVVVADTVGFVRALPTTLVEAFKATLEEVSEADLLVHVIDASADDADELCAEVRSVVAEIGAAEIPTIEVHNKIDQVPEAARPWVDGSSSVLASALTGAGVDALKRIIRRHLGQEPIATEVRLEASEGRVRSWLYQHGDVQQESVDDDGAMTFQVRLHPARMTELGVRQKAGR